MRIAARAQREYPHTLRLRRTFLLLQLRKKLIPLRVIVLNLRNPCPVHFRDCLLYLNQLAVGLRDLRVGFAHFPVDAANARILLADAPVKLNRGGICFLAFFQCHATSL